MKTNQHNLGLYLKELRISKGLSLKDLAKKTQIDISLISRIEAGERTLNLDYVPALADVLGVNFKTLQTDLLAFSVSETFKDEEYLIEGLKKAMKNLKERN